MKSSRAAPADQAAVTQILTSAVAHIDAGRFDQAEKALGAQGGLALRTPVGRNILGDVFLKTGRLPEALRSFDRALKLAPSFPEAHSNRGVVLQEMGRLAEALKAEDRALRHRAGYPMASYNRGNILKQMERFGEALGAYDLALTSRPDFVEARHNRGLTNLKLGEPLKAMADFRAVLGLDPKNLPAIVGRATAYRDTGQPGEALSDLDQALAIDPHHSDSLLLKNLIERQREDYPAAMTSIRTLLAAQPDLASAHQALGETFLQMSRHEEGLAAVDEAIRLAPEDVSARITRAVLLGVMGRSDEQMSALRRAQKLGAEGASFDNARAQMLVERGDDEAAAAAFQKAMDLEPGNWRPRHNLALLKLSRGDLEEGWSLFEARLSKFNHPGVTYDAIAPRWEGEDLAGRKLLVYGEQGHGDTLQFLRFLAPLQKQGAAITLIVPGPLKSFLAENLPGIDVATETGLRSGFAYQISLMSLPAVFRTSLATLPGQAPYLRSQDEYARKWATRLGTDGFRVGLVWQGNPKYPADRFRSISLKHYAPLARVAGVRLISLQVFNGLDQLDDLPPGMEVERLGEEVTNNPSGYREVAGVLANIDLLVTSDTGPAHLAGAMGRPVWVALNDRPDWRWLRERTDSPWYPSLRLFRQKVRGDWAPVFEEIAEALAASAGSAASR